MTEEMIENESKSLQNFFIVGINYKKTQAAIRGQFAINCDQYKNILRLASSYHVSELFVLSTCNRTEVYGFAQTPTQLIELLCSQTVASKEVFEELCYVKNGCEAVKHLYEVGAGLESQILGDYEIIGQIKGAVRFAKENCCLGSFTERLVNSVLQSTKVVKNQTALSGGTVSVSFAAIQYIKENVEQLCSKQILLLGTGKIGRNTCKNVVDYLHTTNITLINRTEEKATALAEELNLKTAPMTALPEVIKASDIILVATNSDMPTILVEHLVSCGDKLIIDLSIPYNVEKGAEVLPNVRLVNVDELSKLKDRTLQKRVAEVPKAKAIIDEHLVEFLDWTNMRRNVPFIKAVKQKLHDMHYCGLYLSSCMQQDNAVASINSQAIQKVIKNMALKMKEQHHPGCCYIQAINDFITIHKN